MRPVLIIAGIFMGCTLSPLIAQTAQQLIIEGNMRATEGDYKGALEDFDNAILIEPGNTKITYFKGNAELMAGRYNDAIVDFSNILKLDTSNLEALLFRGICYIEIKNYFSALDDFNKVIFKDPDFSDAWIERGEVEKLMNNRAQAKLDFESASSLGNPKAAEALKELESESR